MYANGTTYFTHSDWLGTERLRSTVSGGVYSMWTSLPFGEGSSTPNPGPTHFAGKERDAETSGNGNGLDYFGARYFSSAIGRFMTPDWAEKPTAVPYAEYGDPQSLNLYGYVRNNPVGNTDVDGHCLEDACIVEGTVAGLYLLGAYITSPQGQQAVRDAASAANGMLDSAAESIVNGLRSLRNPWGQKGAPDHQKKVKEEADKARAEAGPGETVLEGQKVQGIDSNRRPDVQVVGADGKTKSIVEVERRPGSKRHKQRQEEYDTHKSVPLSPKPQPCPQCV